MEPVVPLDTDGPADARPRRSSPDEPRAPLSFLPPSPTGEP